METEKRISTFSELGRQIELFLSHSPKVDQQFIIELNEALVLAKQKNGWFTEENCRLALEGITQFLRKENLEKWLSAYNLASNPSEPKRIGLIMAGNIPMVGFHDLLTVLISGNLALVKLSSDDQVLLPVLIDHLIKIEPTWKEKIQYIDRLNDAEMVIATGSDNSARYFEYYFRNIPHIIRKNRTSVAVLQGDETEEELKILGKDVFSFFGLGCRNVSQLIIPKDLELDRVFGGFRSYSDIVHHHKYGNNYNYHRAVYALNLLPILENGFMLMREEKQLHSPLSMVHFWRYDSLVEVESFLNENADQIQCVVGRNGQSPANVAFGMSQQPQLWDYADGVDTLKFICSEIKRRG